MKPNPVGWFEIYVQDMVRAKAFYEAVFQTQLTKLENPEVELWGFSMELGVMGSSGALVKIEGCPSGGNSVLVYFSCEDCAVEEARVKANGGEIHRSKFSIGEYGFISLALDTEGNMFGLHSQS